MAKPTPKQLVDETIALESAMKSQRSTWDSLWQDISRYVMPQKSDILEEKTKDVAGWTQHLYDNGAQQANQKLAAGMFDFLVSGRWFAYRHPEELNETIGHDGEKWFATCTQVAQRELNRSNWDLEIHELFLDHGGFGTTAMFTEENRLRDGLRFTTQPIGTYSLGEDDEKRPDVFVKCHKMSVRQMVKKYGLENCHQKVQEMWAKGGEDMNKEIDVIHRLSPRDEVQAFRTAKVKPKDQKPIASIHVDKTHKHLLLDSGYDEQMFVASRFMRWGSDVYGYCPSVLALPVTRSKNMLEKYLDALIEVQVFPRLLIPDSMDGQVDLRSSGVTLFNPNNPNALPREWATQGRYDIGLDRSERMQMMIDEAYHVKLFEALADRTKQMTATEVLELKEEKLVNFSPTFARLRQEIFNPVLTRVFNILYRQGKFPKAPASVQGMLPDGSQAPMAPEVTLTSKLALTMQALQNKNFVEFLAMAEMLLTVKPESADWIKDDAIVTLSKNAGVFAEFIEEEDRVKEIREDRQEAQERAMQAEEAKAMGSALKDASAGGSDLLRAL